MTFITRVEQPPQPFITHDSPRTFRLTEDELLTHLINAFARFHSRLVQWQVMHITIPIGAIRLAIDDYHDELGK